MKIKNVVCVIYGKVSRIWPPRSVWNIKRRITLYLYIFYSGAFYQWTRVCVCVYSANDYDDVVDERQTNTLCYNLSSADQVRLNAQIPMNVISSTEAAVFLFFQSSSSIQVHICIRAIYLRSHILLYHIRADVSSVNFVLFLTNIHSNILYIQFVFSIFSLCARMQSKLN